jgi:hypothetical protein
MKSFGEYRYLENKQYGSLENRFVTGIAELALDFCERTFGKADRLIQKRLKGVLA